MEPAVYQTSPYVFFGALAFLSLLAVVYEMRVKQFHKREKELLGLVDERTVALQASEKVFGQLADNIPEVFWLMDPATGALVYVSPAFEQLWEIPAGQVHADSNAWFERIHADDRALLQETRKRQRSGEPLESEYRIVNGEKARWVWDRAFPIHDEAGQLERVVGVVEEITQRKEAEARLHRSHEELDKQVRAQTLQLVRLNAALQSEKEAAAAANVTKRELLADVSRQIRTPMNGVIGMTQRVLATELSAEQKEYVDIINTAAQTLLKIADDVGGFAAAGLAQIDLANVSLTSVDLAHVDFANTDARWNAPGAGRIRLEHAAFDARECLKEATASFQSKAAAKGLSLTTSISDDVPGTLFGDAVLLRRVLGKLLDNAIQFTVAGTVSASLQVLEQVPAKVTLNFSVADSGVGIPPEKQPRLLLSNAPGSGAMGWKSDNDAPGLALCSGWVTSMGGRMAVESELGKGSCFQFTAAFETSAKREEPTPGASSGVGLTEDADNKILLVEDNPINQRLAVRLLEKNGYSVTVAENGRVALEMLDRFNWNFAAVLMDIQMPEMDGLEATQEIRRLESSGGGHIPVIAVTAHALKRDRERCLAAGMDDYVSKPIDSELLLRTLRGVVARNLPTAAETPAAREA